MSKATFAVGFDDFRRKLEGNPEQPNKPFKLTTAQRGTEEYETYESLFLAPENKTIDVFGEADNKTFTFYTMIPKTTRKTTEENTDA